MSHVGGTHSEPIQTIFGTLCHLIDVINYAKFHLDRSMSFGSGDIGKMLVSFESEVSFTITLLSAAALTVMNEVSPSDWQHQCDRFILELNLSNKL